MNVLSKEPIMGWAVDIKTVANTGWMIYGILIIISLICLLASSSAARWITALMCINACLGIGMIAVTIYGETHKVETGRYRYYVTINDGCDLNDISSRYNIIYQRDELFTLEDKE